MTSSRFTGAISGPLTQAMTGLGRSVPVPLTLPAAFTARWNPSFTIYEQGRNYTTNFDITTLKPSGTTLYVAKTGNDTTGDGSAGNPYRTITKAYAMGASIIMVKAGIYDRGDMTAGLNPTRSIALVSADGPGKAILTRFQAGVLTWTPQTTPNTDVYLCGTAISSVRTILDLTYAYAGEYLKDGTTPLPKPYTSVASIAACQALPGSYFLTGTSLYVHTWDNRAPDTNIGVLRVESNFQAATADTTFYIDGMEVWGDDGVRFIVTTATTSSILAGRNSASRYGGVNLANAWRGNGINYAYAINCECSDYLGNGDGFNYHGDSGNSVAVKFLEVNCVAKRIGKSGDTNDNGTTCHDDCLGIRLNGNYQSSYGPVIADVLALGTLGTLTVNLGCTSGNSLLTTSTGDSATQIAGANCYAWYRNCTFIGDNYALYGATSGTAYNWGGNIDQTTLGNGGTVAAYP